jgi:adenylate kinase
VFVILLGLPGSGKGTQGKFLSSVLGFSHLSIGDMLREIVDQKTVHGELLNSYISQGKLVPSDLINTMVEQFLSIKKYSDNCILDGYPRTLDQASFLEKILVCKDMKVFYLNVDEEVAVKRITGRFSCKKCGQIYNLYYANLRIEGVCDICNNVDFSYRSDDNQLMIIQRIKDYSAETQPLVKYYSDRKMLLTLDANESYDKVSSILLELLKKV